MIHAIEEIKLKNGVAGLLIDVPGAEVVNTQVWFNSGFNFSDPKKFEMPHITEHLLVSANKDYPDSTVFKQEIERNGAYFNAYTNKYFNSYDWECASFEVDRILKLATSQLTKPLITPEDVKTEASRVREELEDAISDHRDVVYDNLMSQFEERPALAARIAQLKGINATDMRRYYTRTHTQQNATVFATGDVKHNRSLILDQLELLTSGLPRGKRLKHEPIKKHTLPRPELLHRDISQVYYAFSFSAGRTSQQEWAAGAMLANMLSSFLPPSLYGAVWKQGLAYGIGVNFGFSSTSTGFSVFGNVSPGNIEKLYDVIAKQLKSIIDGKFSAKDLEAAKKISAGKQKIGFQYPRKLLNFYADNYILFDEVMDLDQWLDLKKGVTKTDIQQFAKKLIGNSKWAMSFVGPTDEDQAGKLHDKIKGLRE